MSSNPIRGTGSPRTIRYAALPLGLVAAAIGLAGCSGSSGGAATPTPIATAGPVGNGNGNGGVGGGDGQRIPGASGLVAAVEGSTMQVQSATKQTAVTWTATTRFTRTVTGSLADVTVGSCVSVRAEGSSTGGAPVTATVVDVTPATNGSCVTGFGNGRGGIPGGGASGMPTGAPNGTARPTGGPADARGFGGVFGQVTSVSPSGFAVQGFARVAPNGTGAPDPSATPTATGAPVEVSVTPATTYAVSKAAAATDVKVGLCATAIGAVDQTGAVTATTVALRDSVNGACTQAGGFGARGSAGGAPGGGMPGAPSAVPGSTGG